MFEFCSYIPTKVVFGPGKLKELASMKLPGQEGIDLCDGRWSDGKIRDSG